MLVGRKIRMNMPISCTLVWLSMRNTSMHVPQAKVFVYKLAGCKQPRMTGLSIPWAPSGKYSYLMIEFDGPEVRLMSLSRLETCSVPLVGKEICGL